ncbi:uncharacterized protein FTOL_05441 [Fusarium torulosum]|uniref:Uncharacterized protein n=1 Tax=Fusarium torulosum TaxID=33205 RepID=A0AAE8M7R2_9HYPO|nr:uncharacterized protein FTOL_05441 [Fusarium torulosum]
MIHWKYSPCFHSNPAVDMLGRHNACQDIANYMIGLWTKDPFTMFSEGLGTAKETLNRLEFNKELIVRRAEAIQNKTREFIPRGMGFSKDALEEASQNNVQNVEDLLWFNIPVCDLAKLSGPLSYGDNYYKDLDNPVFSTYCMHSVTRENCHKVKMNGHERPLS